MPPTPISGPYAPPSVWTLSPSPSSAHLCSFDAATSSCLGDPFLVQSSPLGVMLGVRGTPNTEQAQQLGTQGTNRTVIFSTPSLQGLRGLGADLASITEQQVMLKGEEINYRHRRLGGI